MRNRFWLPLLAVTLFTAGCASVPQFDNKQYQDAYTSLGVNLTDIGGSVTSAYKKIGEGIDASKKGPPGEVIPSLVSARDDLAKANQKVTNAKAEAGAMSDLNAHLVDELGAEKAAHAKDNADAAEAIKRSTSEYEKKLAAVTNERDSYQAKYEADEKKWHDSWFAGKFWRLVYWVTGISALLLIVSIILNIKTDLFVTPIKWAAKLFL